MRKRMVHRGGPTIDDTQGGGIGQPNLIDEISVSEHTDHHPAEEMAEAIVDYDDVYDVQVTGREQPMPNPYTANEARDDLAHLARLPYPKGEISHQVAQVVYHGTVVIQPNADPYPLAEYDQYRSRIVITNLSTTQNVHLGNSPAVPLVRGPGVRLLTTQGVPGGNTYEGFNTEPVYLVLPLGASVSATVTYSIEKYRE